MEINAKKTKDMWMSFKKTPPPLHINNVELERVTQFKLLGVAVQNNLKWSWIAGERLRTSEPLCALLSSHKKEEEIRRDRPVDQASSLYFGCFSREKR